MINNNINSVTNNGEREHDMPIVSNYDKKEESKPINHESSNSSFISDLESD